MFKNPVSHRAVSYDDPGTPARQRPLPPGRQVASALVPAVSQPLGRQRKCVPSLHRIADGRDELVP